MRRIFNQRGISLIEVLAAGAILSIVAIAAGGFLLSNLFSYNSASNNITLEREARAAMNAITDTVRKGSGVNAVTGTDGTNLMGSMDSKPVSKLEFSDTLQITAHENELILDGTTLCRTLKADDIGRTEGLYVQPLPEGTSFKNCTGVKIKLILEKNKKTYNIESEAYFRNSR